MFWHMQIFPGDAPENKRIEYTKEALEKEIIGFGCGCEPLPDENDQKFLNSITNKGFAYKYHKVTRDNKTLNKVLVGPFKTKSEANEALLSIREKIAKDAFILKTRLH